MNKIEIIAAVKKAVEIAKTLVPSFVCPEIGFYEKGTVAGRAYRRVNKVEFNLTLARENPEDFMNTIVHEVAHLVTHIVYPFAKQAHGPEFKHIFRTMGGNGKRCHSYDLSNAKREVVRTYAVYKCDCREHNITPSTHEKISKGTKVYRCNSCKTRLSAVLVGTAVKVVKISNKAK